MLRSGLLLALTGCPFVFGPPDLSNVDPSVADADTDTDADADTDTDTDTDTDADADTDSGTLPPTGSPPEVVLFELFPRFDQVIVRFIVLDPDDDLLGGQIEVHDGVQSYLFEIPADVPQWADGEENEVVLLRDDRWLFPDVDLDGAPDCDTSASEPWTLTATDLAGHVGSPALQDLTVPTLGLLPELGNDWPDNRTVSAEAPPFVVCGGFEATDSDPYNDDVELRNDIELVEFETPTMGRYVAQLQWEGQLDIDLYVYPLPSLDIDQGVFAATVGTFPEEVTVNAQAGERWLYDPFFFGAFSGEYPPYIGLTLITPE